jgi:hypothetical protein
MHQLLSLNLEKNLKLFWAEKANNFYCALPPVAYSPILGI